MRFQSPSSGHRTGMSRRERWRLGMLLVAFGLVAMAMRHLGKPQTAARLDELFTPKAAATDSETAAPKTIDTDAGASTENTFRIQSSAVEEPELEESSESTLPRDQRVEGLSLVKDKTYFRPAEEQAWFNLLAQLQGKTLEEISEASAGEVACVQLLKQPEVYRGRLVSIRGTVMREEVEQAGKNELGIETYHRLWIQPRGGGRTPFVVYCLELPAGFPRGENKRAAVSLTGYFFKNWSYSAEGGLALAPVILASGFSWERPASAKGVEPVPSWTFVVAFVVACLLGVLVAWFAMRRARTRVRLGLADLLPEEEEGQ